MSQHSPSYAITVRLRYRDEAGLLGRITTAIGEEHGFIGAVDIVGVSQGQISRDITINASDVEHGQRIVERLKQIDGIEVVNVSDRVFLMHLGGKIEVNPKAPIKTRDDLSMAYTPGVARVCKAIHEDPESSFSLTIRKNTVAVVSDGSAVLGLGNIGPRAAMPVMEGKAMLFKEFGGVDAFPICLETQDTEEIIETVARIAPSFGGINLEDISAPRCLEIEERLESMLEIPVFHDDQHGTAIVVLAGLKNSLQIVGKQMDQIRVLINGSGAAGTAIAKLLIHSGVKNVVVCDSRGAINRSRDDIGDNAIKVWLSENTNHEGASGPLADVIHGHDVFIGVSIAGVLKPEDVANMADDAIVFALANPDPEITPTDAGSHARIMATGRSDFPNQINNVLCFPGLFRGVLDVRASRINTEMKIAAADAIAAVIEPENLTEYYIIPSVFDRRVAGEVASAVAETALATGTARRKRKMAFQVV
ncbi:NAD-dependent malic enzyme [Roseiconus nitratireducens]|uniref:NAD-dependent malic enzyme n=1 Tax=Roseiconus nitratireducens TaxID=2605748 RepID=A0A5M6DGF8_9BACT|nr:NAD-dependent malic enzyme [Roseiconus nitratireducens]KAA5545289.1 NAD-dependent malic enzyme [Roseiconus nitratireducens]